MEWTREKDIELLAAFASGEQHNWFVFCRVNEVMIDETSSRMDYLRQREDIEDMRKEARALFESKRSKLEDNAQALNSIVNKGAPASPEDKQWLSDNEWLE